MGNFAENLNLGNRVRPPPPRHDIVCIILEDLYTKVKVQFHHQLIIRNSTPKDAITVILYYV